MIWTADKLIYRGQENFIRAFSGDTKVWERTKSPSLIFSATGAQTVSLTNNNGNAPSLEYSYDGHIWSAWTYTALSFGTTEHPQVYVRGKNIAGFSQSSSIYSKFAFGNSTSVDVSGNVMALINWENVPTTIPSNYCFYSLFNGATALKSVSTLPATTLTDGCYSNMFYGCTNLTTAPTLPASEVKSVSYASMFRNCTALRIAPSLPATTIGTYCYSQMFDGCTSLVVPPSALPATTSMQGCYEYMFRDCRNMTSAPALSATNAANRCYQYMFSGCRSLTSIDYNYLPATTVADRAYQCMFQGCGFAKAPELPATTLGYLSYAQMFQGCSSLNEIHCLATALTASNKSTENWVYGVASAGTFYSYANAPFVENNVSGIPIGWTPKDIDIKNYTYFKADSAQTVSFSSGGTFYYSYGRYGHYMLATGPIEFGTSGKETVFVAGDNSTSIGNAVFSTDALVQIGGSINGLYTCHSVNTSTLPSASLEALYSGCTALKSVSSDYLKATTLKDKAYRNMFKGCTNLLDPPALPATKVYTNGYESMFEGCTALKNAPALPATVVYFASYYKMFRGCTSLITAPELTALTATYHSCYRQMFEGCTALTQAPSLPLTSVAQASYTQMFKDCTSLVNAPALSATTLGSECYYQMFYGCTALTNAPSLPAEILVRGCYKEMFRGCTSLNEIHTDATDISASACTENWLKDVAPTGRFYGNVDTPWEVDSPNGIPVGWTMPIPYISFTSNAEQTVTKPTGFSDMEYSYDKSTWNTMSGTAIEFGTSEHPTIYVRGKNSTVYNFPFRFGNDTAKVSVGGNCIAIIDWENIPLYVPSYGFENLFSGCTALQSVSSNFLPSTELRGACYSSMFYGCTSLVNAPALPATTLPYSCYASMFEGCTSLVNAPALPATTLNEGCYYRMFKNCTSLVSAPALPATTMLSYSYNYMFQGCTSLVTPPALPATTMAVSCYAYMFEGCTALTSTPALPATTIEEKSYESMFEHCTSLVSAPALPAMTMKDYCYDHMFRGCTSLTSTPALPATTLVEGCYMGMFESCTALNEIHCDATYIKTSHYSKYCTYYWTNGVASTGDFYGKTAADWPDGVDGIPNGWNKHLD